MGFVIFFGFLVALALIASVAASKRKGGQATAKAREPMSQRAKSSMGTVLLDGLSLEWTIVYEDGKGERTQRNITVRALVGRKRPYYAWAFCHLRQEERHFQFDRMIVVVNRDTNRRIHDVAAYVLCLYDEANGVVPVGTAATKHLAVQFETNAIEPAKPIGIRYEGADFKVQVSEHGRNYARPYFRGRAHRPRTAEIRAWTGNKSFYLDQPHSLFDPDTGENIADFGEWLRHEAPADATHERHSRPPPP